MGRWILRRGSLAAAESALLVYTIAFEDLALDRVYCRTVSANRAVVSFHRDGTLDPPPRVARRCRKRAAGLHDRFRGPSPRPGVLPHRVGEQSGRFLSPILRAPGH